MGKILCEVALECVLKAEPIVIKQYGVETIYAVDVEFQSTKTKRGTINLNYPNSLDLDIHEGDILSVRGELRSIKIENTGNNVDEYPYYSKLYVLARQIEKLDAEPKNMKNEVTLYNILLYSTPKLRKSYNDDSVDITSFVVKYERSNDKSSYLYCVAWYSLARLIAKMPKGTRITGTGNLQSRYSHDCLFNEICISSITATEEDVLPEYTTES